MKGRDWLLLFLCLSVLWILLPSSSSLSIVQKWRIPFDTAEFRNSHYPEEWEKLPHPIITDINNDGIKDIIFVNTDYEVAIVYGQDIHDFGEEASDPVMLNKFSKSKDAHLKLQNPELTPSITATLLPEFGIKFGRRPVALASGYIDPPSSQRKQVIVVLTEGWVTMCFNHELDLMWENHAVEEPDPQLFHFESAIHIHYAPVTNGDRGLVVVAARKSTQQSIGEAVHEHFEKEDFFISEEDIAAQRDQYEMDKADKFFQQDDEDVSDHEADHFSYYAYEGHTGVQRWKHEPGDWESTGPRPNPEKIIEAFTQAVTSTGTNDPSFTLHLFHNLRHLGEQKWFAFEDDIRAQLPALWRTRTDTWLKGARFQRERSFGRAESSEIDLDDRWNPTGLNELRSAFTFASEEEEVTRPNVIVSHTHDGIEVIHYFSGRPLCRLDLKSGNLYADVNNDGVIDKVDTISERVLHLPKEGQTEKSGVYSKNTPLKCVVSVSSGVPTYENLFEAQVCSTKSLQKLKLGLDPSKGKTGDIDFAHPAAIRQPSGHYDLYFLVSNGRVAAVQSNGEIRWMKDTDVKWSQRSDANNPNMVKFSKMESFLEMGGFPSIEPFSMYGKGDYLVAVGYHTIALLDAQTGKLQAESRLPTVVNGPVVIGDWDSDGDNDIIVPCINGFVGLRVTTGASTPLYSILFGLILLAVPLLYFVNQSGTKPAKKRAAPQGL